MIRKQKVRLCGNADLYATNADFLWAAISRVPSVADRFNGAEMERLC